jgi:phosphoribosylformylglycinamidine (FGAM) synthase-like enzyme
VGDRRAAAQRNAVRDDPRDASGASGWHHRRLLRQLIGDRRRQRPRFHARADGRYAYHEEPTHILAKVETHNHPTAISPFPGAATGAGGEIRDEGATGRGSKPKAGLCGFSVSNLNIPGRRSPGSAPIADYGRPARIASALAIMLEGPIGAAAFNNEFGRPNLAGYFRTYEQLTGSGDGRSCVVTTSRSCSPAASATSPPASRSRPARCRPARC